MKFNIVDGGDSPEFIERFVELYNDKNYTISDIKRILDLSIHKYRRIKRDLVADGRIDGDLRRVKPTYITFIKKSGKFVVQKRVGGRMVQFTRYPDRERAELARDFYLKYGWSKNNTQKIRKEVERMIQCV